MRQLKINKQITNRESASLDRYLLEIGKEKLISIEEEVVLGQRIKKGDKIALNKLVKANLRFVVSVAKQHQNHGLSLPDLISNGNRGLIKAAERFDETRGFRFISYAVWWIRQFILQALSEQTKIVRVPLNKLALRNKIDKASSKFEQENERRPLPIELAEILELSIGEVIDTLGISLHVTSIDAPLDRNDENSSNLLDVLTDKDFPSPNNTLMMDSLATEIKRALATITERERDIVQMFFGIGGREMTLEEIGEEFGITRERARQIKEKAIRQLRSPPRARILKSYLD